LVFQEVNMFETVRKRRASDQVAEAIRDRILSGDIAPGQKLPAERELATQFGVNRTTLREALRSIEQLGLVTIQHGGGVVACDPRRAGLQVLPFLLTLGGHVDPDILWSFLEVRRVVGAAIARLAAERRTEDDLAGLKDAIMPIEAMARSETPYSAEALGALDLRFFLALAGASQNRVFRFLLNAMRGIYRAEAPLFQILFPDARKVAQCHTAVYTAIQARDAETAARLVESYLGGDGDVPEKE
jgi:GntR family transcriptional regulator, transcriptional repressor for pyruvate dehydrogenase complex